VAVTVYRGQALVTREVSVPEGDGTAELVVTPMPPLTVDGSLFTEGTDGLRVLATRFRTRAVKDDTRLEVRAKAELLKKLEADAERLQKDAAVQEQDLQYLKKLEGFTSAALTALTEKGRLDSEAVLTLSKFVMENRGTKTKAEVELQQRLKANAEAAEFAKRQLAELSDGSSRIERDAVIVVHKIRPGAGTVRLGYLVNSANWWPQYRLRGAADNASVRLEYLADVVQQTGEAWPGVAVTLSTARPSLDAAPPDLLPLKMAVSLANTQGPIEATDEPSQRIAAELGKQMTMSFPQETPLEDVLKYIKSNTQGRAFPDGIPIYVDPIGLQTAEKTLSSPVTLDLSHVPLRTTLKLLLQQLDLTYQIKDGLLKITAMDSDDVSPNAFPSGRTGSVAGMGGMGMLTQESPTSGGAMLNHAAAGEQAEELRVADGQAAAPIPAEKDGPGISFPIAGRLDFASRREPQLLEVARFELPAEYYAKAVPVLTPRVYRLAKLTNKSDFVLLPGDAMVYVGSDFVGRMRLPLVAAGEPFIAGFGVDPQLQVSRRLVQKSRSVQGGNQILTYEFRLGLRNYRPGPVKVQLWDRLPKPQGEAVAVNLVKTSAELSKDGAYQRTARMDNLLRWDIDVPPGTVGEKTLYLNYEFRLEYSRDLPQLRFDSGGLREAPIGGGAMGGMGGMGGMGMM
jgi:Domain of unknown function (DUF4139)/N-terminal domain of unknown function (DUF4140)